jgi:hypothetical protein
MHIYKNGKEVNYNDLDIEIAHYFKAHYDRDTFTVIPNSKGYLNNIDWYSMLSQAEPTSFEDIINFYKKDFEDTIKAENKQLEDLVPHLIELIKFLKENNYQITS